MRFKTKNIFKKGALVLAGVAALTAVGFGVKAIVDYSKNDLKTINLSYDVGNLGDDGKYVNDDSTMYTKEAFACYGLQVKPDFDSTVNYQIYYYDILDNFISSTSMLSEGFSDEAPINGAYARIVIEPQEDEDGKISFLEKYTYANQLTVKVYKTQDINNRFFSFGGNLMQVVTSVDDVVFKAGVRFDYDYNWVQDYYFSSSSVTALKVSRSSTVSFDFDSFESATSEYCFSVIEFSSLPSVDSLVVRTKLQSGQSLVTNKKTRYLIFVLYHPNLNSNKITESQLALFTSLLNVE